MTLLAHQLAFEQRIFWRSREAAVFIFIFPLLLYALLGSVYSDEIDGAPGRRRPPRGALRLRGREHGVRRTRDHPRRRGARAASSSDFARRPSRRATYIAAVLLSTLLLFALQAVALLALGEPRLRRERARELARLRRRRLLGVACFAGLGVGAASLIRSAEGVVRGRQRGPAPDGVPLRLVRPDRGLPGLLEAIADVLPLTYFLDIVNGVYLDGESLFADPTALAVVAAWGAAGVVVALRWFSWMPREQ